MAFLFLVAASLTCRSLMSLMRHITYWIGLGSVGSFDRRHFPRKRFSPFSARKAMMIAVGNAFLLGQILGNRHICLTKAALQNPFFTV